MVRYGLQGLSLVLLGVCVVQLHYLTRATCPAYDADYRRLCALLMAGGPQPADEVIYSDPGEDALEAAALKVDEEAFLRG